MLYRPNYAGALRCIGQALQNQKIEVFELRTHADEFRLQGGDPNPPYIAVIELRFSIENITILDREGQARRRRSNAEIRFDSIPEILRAVGEYIDSKRGYLRHVNNTNSSSFDDPAVEIEYESRAGDVRSETLEMSFIREAVVRMYKRRARISNPINILTRQR
jgi:hypothetical protein